MILEAVLQDKRDQSSFQVAWEILVENIRNRICENILKPGSNKEGRMEGEINTYYQKGGNLRFPVEI